MEKDIFKERERALEAAYFHNQDAKLIEKLRESARLEEIAVALAEKLQVDNPELLHRVMELGVTLDTAPAFLLAPLVQVAWAEGEVTEREHKTVLRLAGARGVEESSPAHAQLLEWLQERPPDALFDTATEVIKVGLSVLPPGEREERIKRIVQACHEVAEASGGLARVLGLGSGVSGEEESLLDAITTALRDHRRLEKNA
jgi:tellurite resistance protein